MNRSVLMRVICLSALLVVLGCAPDAAFAQRGGGHGGGGGFHGGGVAYRGGAMGRAYSSGGWRGGSSRAYWGSSRSGWGWGSSGWRSSGWGGCGWSGWSGCGWGWGGCGWGGCGWGGWTFGLSFGWGSPWPANTIVVAPAPVWVVTVPNSAAPASAPSWDPPPDNQSRPNVQNNLPPAPASATVAPSVFYANSANMRYRSRVASQRAVPATPAGHYLKASYAKEPLTPLTPEAQNAVRALRAMPPYAQAEQLSRYGSLSPEEVKVVRAVVGMPPI
jgi:hypothetical protein